MLSRPNATAALNHLPRLNRGDVNHHCAKRHAPFPRDTPVFEDLGVDHGDVHDGEHDRESSDDREEEEAVAPEGGEDGEGSVGGGGGGGGVHVKQGAGEVFDFPGGDE